MAPRALPFSATARKLRNMQSNDKPAPTLQDLLEVETTVWQALCDGDAAADLAMLTADFLGVYPSGFAGRADHAGQLDQGPSVAEYALQDARILTIGPDAALLSYRAGFRRPGAQDWSEMYVSSLWERGADGWRNRFSQDTPVGD